MKINSILTIILILVCIHLNAQKKDIIIILEGDSILCEIDSMTNEYIYFEMIQGGQLIQTKVLKREVKLYEENLYKDSDFKLKKGSSIIEGPYGSMKDINKNSIFFSSTIVTNSIHYERLIPINNILSTGLSAGFDFMFDKEKPVSIFELNFSLFNPKNSFEFGPGIYTYLRDFKSAVYTFHAGYKYLGPNGFLFKIYPMLVKYESDILPDVFPWIGISVGYNF
jgi:hypothetical protein